MVLKKVILIILISFYGLFDIFSYNYDYSNVMYAGGVFVVIGVNSGGTWIGNELGKGVLFVSDDGVNFTKADVDANVPLRFCASDDRTIIAAGGGILMETYGFKHFSEMFISTDKGKSWKEVNSIYNKKLKNKPAFTDYYLISYLEYIDGYFTAVTDNGEIHISKDGLEWKNVFNSQLEVTGMRIIDNTMIIWGFNSYIVSGSGKRWEIMEIEGVNSITNIYYENGMYKGAAYFDCCYGEVPSGVIYYDLDSKNGRYWKVSEQNRMNVVNPTLDFTFYKNYYYGINNTSINRGKYYTVLDRVVLEDNFGFADIASSGDVIVVCSINDICKYSYDGENWKNCIIK